VQASAGHAMVDNVLEVAHNAPSHLRTCNCAPAQSEGAQLVERYGQVMVVPSVVW